MHCYFSGPSLQPPLVSERKVSAFYSIPFLKQILICRWSQEQIDRDFFTRMKEIWEKQYKNRNGQQAQSQPESTPVQTSGTAETSSGHKRKLRKHKSLPTRKQPKRGGTFTLERVDTESDSHTDNSEGKDSESGQANQSEESIRTQVEEFDEMER